MPTNRKKKVSARRQKTGESYQGALRNIRGDQSPGGTTTADYEDLFVLFKELAAHVSGSGDTVWVRDDPGALRLGFMTTIDPWNNDEGRWWTTPLTKVRQSLENLKDPPGAHYPLEDFLKPDNNKPWPMDALTKKSVLRHALRTRAGRIKLAQSVPGQRTTVGHEWRPDPYADIARALYKVKRVTQEQRQNVKRAVYMALMTIPEAKNEDQDALSLWLWENFPGADDHMDAQALKVAIKNWAETSQWSILLTEEEREEWDPFPKDDKAVSEDPLLPFLEVVGVDESRRIEFIRDYTDRIVEANPVPDSETASISLRGPSGKIVKVPMDPKDLDELVPAQPYVYNPGLPMKVQTLVSLLLSLNETYGPPASQNPKVSDLVPVPKSERKPGEDYKDMRATSFSWVLDDDECFNMGLRIDMCPTERMPGSYRYAETPTIVPKVTVWMGDGHYSVEVSRQAAKLIGQVTDLAEKIREVLRGKTVVNPYYEEPGPFLGTRMVQCPFHDDQVPSMAIDHDRFFCPKCKRQGFVKDLPTV